MQLCRSPGYAAVVHHCFKDLESLQLDRSQNAKLTSPAPSWSTGITF